MKHATTSCLAVLCAVLSVVASAQSAQRARAEISCTPTATAHVFACVMALRDARTGAAIDKAEATVKADMPSMPMMHNLAPVAAAPGETPGQYRFELKLDMHGDWALQVTVEKPLRDRLVEVLSFEGTQVVPAKARSKGSAAGSGPGSSSGSGSGARAR
jgi:hypothetical protein